MSNSIFVEPKTFFQELVGEAFEQRKLKTIPLIKSYVSDLLIHFIHVNNLFEDQPHTGKKSHPTLAELYFKAMSTTSEERQALLKKLGDTSLYISGVFGDSLQRKLVDIDYYADMGGAAYLSLSDEVEDTNFKELYSEIASKFIEIMEVLTIVSQNTLIQNNQNLLRLYENYVRTGSELAKEHLLEKGLLHLPEKGKKRYSQ